MDEATRPGLDISADVYPYTFWQSTITVIIPTRDWSDRAAWTKGLAEVGGAEPYPADRLHAGRRLAGQDGCRRSPP